MKKTNVWFRGLRKGATTACLVAVIAVAATLQGCAGAQRGAAEPAWYGTWFETAWAVWPGDVNASFNVYVRNTGSGAIYWRTGQAIEGGNWMRNWTRVNDAMNAPLVRVVDHARGTWRVDIPGLPQGTYDIEIRGAGGNVVRTATGLNTRAFPRYGAAFVPSNELPHSPNNHAPHGATGGYLSDGRVDPNAVIIYVSHQNWANFTPANLAPNSALRGGRPLIVRFLGTVGHFDRVDDSFARAGAVLPPAAMADGENVGRMFQLMPGSNSITFEGVGPDAVIFGWGIATGTGLGLDALGSSNLVFRNLTFDMYYQFGIRITGGMNNPGAASSNVWVHNNTLRYGQNLFFHRDDETDRSMARGVVDVEPAVRGYTVAFNHFIEVDKTHLVLGGNQNAANAPLANLGYGTFHHNWYQGTRERNPRVRHHNVHVFNNLFQDILGHPFHYRLADRHTGYAIGAGNNATIWAEGNIFENVNFPFVRSRHGHARGYAPHLGHNHLFGDGPGFIVTGNNVGPTGALVGSMTIPATTAAFGYQNNVVWGNTTLDDLRNAVAALQPNVLDAATQGDFNPALDIGVTVDQAAFHVMPPPGDQLTVAGFPAAGAVVFEAGWGFNAAFRPSALNDVWSTSSPSDAAALRRHIETYAGTMPAPTPGTAPAQPSTVNVAINNLEYLMHRQNSPMPSLRIITYEGTFSITWGSGDAVTEWYEIGVQVGNAWRVLERIPADARPNVFVTQEITDLGNLVFHDPAGNDVFVHSGGNGDMRVLYPRLGFPGVTAVPSVASLSRTDKWVIANPAGGSQTFGVRAGNAAGVSAWSVQTINYPARPRIDSVAQAGAHLAANTGNVTFNVATTGIPNGTHNITLSVPRSVARDRMPWPAARNFTGAIALQGVDTAPLMHGDHRITPPPPANIGRPTGNGGTGTITVTNGVGVVNITIHSAIPAGAYDLVLTIQAGAAVDSHIFTLMVN